MPRQTEPSVNNVLGAVLQGMMRGCRVRSETVRTIVDQPGLQPDILITQSGRAPIVIEAEFDPARNVEGEASSRLGLEVVEGRRAVETVISLRYPDSVADADDLEAAVSDGRFSYCILFAEPSGSRFPESGWLHGSASDLADLIRLVSVPQKAVNDAADALERGIERVAAVLDEPAEAGAYFTMEVARVLGMANVPQTRRMACAIIANALIFHERIAAMSDNDVLPLRLVCGRDVPYPKSLTLAAWSEILEVNYWPIFAVGKDILERIPAGPAARILNTLELTAEEVNSAGVDNSHDLTGHIFQRLIVDRKYLATFYTLPASAALLARLAVAKMNGVDWSDAEAIGKLRIGDFACGTGALLSAVYEQIAARHERAGGDPAALHPTMMEEALYGCDVMPSAVHITSSTLSGAHPNVGFGNSRVYTLPYGRLRDGDVALGSLELLTSDYQLTQSNFTDPALRSGSIGEETAAQVMVDIPHEGFDMVVMNPPFTSNTKHYDAASGVLNAAFAAFNADADEQAEMAKRLRSLAKGSSYHGHAGLASAFVSLADRKLRPNGIMALVLPFTAVNGPSWAKFRDLVAEGYTDITVVSIAANGYDMSFSSDTGMADCLIIGRKKPEGEDSSVRAKFSSLRRRPQSFLEASEVSTSILDDSVTRRLEDGPYGGVPIYSGDDLAGEVLDAPIDTHENGWSAARILDASVAQSAHSLSKGELWLPGEQSARDLPIARLSQIGQRGLDSQMFVSAAHRGPFSAGPASPTATYPALWNHQAEAERYMVCSPDLSLRVKPGMEERAAELWATASRTHINRDFRFTSQPLAAAFTERKSIGGVAWPNVSLPDRRFEYPFVLWFNSTFGLLLFWWRANRQQSGRGRKTIRSSETLPVLDFRALTDGQLATAKSIFNEFQDKELMPAYLADADPNRALLDRRVTCDLLGFDEGMYEAVRRLSQKWCAEPSVHGGKRRPRGARFVP